jgi:hypothetical protein
VGRLSIRKVFTTECTEEHGGEFAHHDRTSAASIVAVTSGGWV